MCHLNANKTPIDSKTTMSIVKVNPLYSFLLFTVLVVVTCNYHFAQFRTNYNPVVSIVVLLFVIYLLSSYLQMKHSYWKRMGIHSPPSTFIVGHTLKRLGIVVHFKEFFEDVYYQHDGKEFCGLYEFLKPGIMVGNLELVRNIIVKDFDHFSNRFNFDLIQVNTIINEMLPFCTGERWKHVRTSLSPTFTAHKLRQLTPLINDLTQSLVNILIEKASNKTEVEAQVMCGKFTMDTIASCAFGIECEAMQSDASQFARMAAKIFTFSPIRAIKMLILIAAPSIARTIEALGVDFTSPEFLFFQKVATQTLKLRAASGIRRGDFLDLMKDTGKLSQTMMEAQSVLFILAGYDNTANVMAFLLHLLATHPPVQTKLRKEILEANLRLSGGTYEAVNEIPYLEAVLKETLRLYPGSVDIQRVCTKDYIIPGTEITIKKGQNVIVPVWSIHRDPKHWPQPEAFYPERFLEEYDKNAYLPFGMGPRACIGRRFASLVVKMGVCQILSSLEIKPTINTEQVPTLVQTAFTIKAKNRLPLSFRVLE